MFLAVALNWQAMMLCIPLAVMSAVGFIQAGQRAFLVAILVEIIIANIVFVFVACGFSDRRHWRGVLLHWWQPHCELEAFL